MMSAGTTFMERGRTTVQSAIWSSFLPYSAPGTADLFSASSCLTLHPRAAKEREKTTDPSLPKSSL